MAELSVRISFTFVSDRREDSTPPTRSRRVRTRLRRLDLRLLCRGGRSQLRLSRALLRFPHHQSGRGGARGSSLTTSSGCILFSVGACRLLRLCDRRLCDRMKTSRKLRRLCRGPLRRCCCGLLLCLRISVCNSVSVGSFRAPCGFNSRTHQIGLLLTTLLLTPLALSSARMGTERNGARSGERAAPFGLQPHRRPPT